MAAREVDLLPQIRVKVEQHIHDAIKKAAAAENRSMSNWLDTVVMNALMQKGYKNDIRRKS